MRVIFGVAGAFPLERKTLFRFTIWD
jgi:hypothetical protein